MTPRKHYETVDEYFADFPKDVQVKLSEMRRAIREAAPDAEETISYQMPAYRLNGVLVWYAAFKDHIGFFPRETAIAEFKQKLAGYKISKGTIQFPIEKPIPIDLVKEIVEFRVKENLSRGQTAGQR